MALQRLDKLQAESAPRLRFTALLQDDEGGSEEGEVEVTLATASLSADDRRALCAYLEGLELQPDEENLSAPSAGCEAIASRCVKLPDRTEGMPLKPGTILLLGAPDEDADADGGEDADGGWLGRSEPAMRIYYDHAVKPHQARGAKVLGWVTANLKFLSSAKPGGVYHLSGWGARYDRGKVVTLSNAKFVAE